MSRGKRELILILTVNLYRTFLAQEILQDKWLNSDKNVSKCNNANSR